MTLKVGYGFLNDIIDDYIDSQGITKASADILTIIALKLSRKADMLESQLKEGDDRCSSSGLP